MSTFKALKPDALRRVCDPGQFTFETTADLEHLDEIIGQKRAVEATRFGIGIRREGYNLYVMGEPGTGKHTALHQFLKHASKTETKPNDWCYVNNFEQPHKPKALRLPAGQGGQLRQDMVQLIEDLHTAIRAIFEGDDYQARRQAIQDTLKTLQDQALDKLKQEAKERNIALITTPAGLGFAPIHEGRVLNPSEFTELPEEEQKALQAQGDMLQEQLQATMNLIQKWDREIRDEMKALDEEVTRSAAEPLVGGLRIKYTDLPDVLTYLTAVEEDVVKNSDAFRKTENLSPEVQGPNPLPRSLMVPPVFRSYQVNVVVGDGVVEGAPVIYEDHPTYQNLIGRIEHLVAQNGAFLADFTLIKGGALHRANAGYLMLDALKLLQQPYAWEQLKRSLRAREIRIESLAQVYGLVSTVSLEPEPIPLAVKIVLIGDRRLYYALCTLDPDFKELFKVTVDFEDEMERTWENNHLYARLMGTLAHKEGLRHLDRAAVAHVIEHSSRLVSDTDKLSTRMLGIADLLREADYWAKEAEHDTITINDIQQAIDTQIYRVSRIREQIQEDIYRGTILIDTQGERVGQINALSVLSLGDMAFGRPSRITALVRLGKGEVVDIEREVELGGPLHTKGVMILSSFLGGRYVVDRPLSLRASLVFEQSYGGVDGDSASSAELYALLSALAQVPLKQSLAVTGSVNQHGQVQAIGGVNEKIEGFFDICQARGLTSQQGVLIPATNVKHLMLRQDVVAAATAGNFHIYPVATVDEGIEILTGMPAGEALKTPVDGRLFPDDTINGLVEARLIALSDTLRNFDKDTKVAD